MKDITLFWEWPEDRVPTQTLRVSVKKIKKTSGGLFGLKKSPSYLYNYPDSMELTGTVIGGDQHTDKKSLLLTLPLEYLGGASAGDVVELGIINSSACISLIKC